MDINRERRQTEWEGLQAMANASRGHMTVTTSPDRSEFTIRFHNLPAPVGTSESSYSIANEHELRITLPANFPEVMPSLTFKRPLFHPNCFTSGGYCHGSQWYAARTLDELVAQLVRNVQIRGVLAFNLGSPANSNAARFYSDSSKLAALRRRLSDITIMPVYTPTGEADPIPAATPTAAQLPEQPVSTGPRITSTQGRPPQPGNAIRIL